MLVYFGFAILLLTIGVHSASINNTLEEDNYESNEFQEEDLSHSKNGSRLIFPGTKWCGPGNTASSEEELGHFAETDKCCRAHDHCDGIEAGGSKYGLKNDSPYTKLHCACDRAFYKCMKGVDEVQSHMIGEMYFIANEKCYKKAHPIIECEDHIYFLWMRRCNRYKVDPTQPKVYQYFDLPFYDTIERSSVQRKSCYRNAVVSEDYK